MSLFTFEVSVSAVIVIGPQLWKLWKVFHVIDGIMLCWFFFFFFYQDRNLILIKPKFFHDVNYWCHMIIIFFSFFNFRWHIGSQVKWWCSKWINCDQIDQTCYEKFSYSTNYHIQIFLRKFLIAEFFIR